jgi:acetyl-CoA carboxylase biotin carboxyl carrier protein
MELDLIEQLAGVVSRTTIEELEFSEGGQRIRLVKNKIPAQPRSDGMGAESPSSRPFPLSSSAQPSSLHALLAGMNGTFYIAPTPGEEPFAKVGDFVKEGQVVAVVEAMKMLNQIEADVDGMVVRVGARDGTAVTSTTVLFEIEPAARSHV